MKRVVLDSNVFIAAAFNEKSASARIIEMVREGGLEHVWHRRTRAETKALMDQIPPIDFELFADVFGGVGEFIEELKVDELDFIADPDDRKFAALGQQAEAVVITNDEHLLATVGLLSVMKPSVFLRSLRD